VSFDGDVVSRMAIGDLDPEEGPQMSSIFIGIALLDKHASGPDLPSAGAFLIITISMALIHPFQEPALGKKGAEIGEGNPALSVVYCAACGASATSAASSISHGIASSPGGVSG
jgi:hypothetical protein